MHLGIQVLVVVLYKLVLQWGSFGGMPGQTKASLERYIYISIYLYVYIYSFQYIYHIKTQIHILFDGSRGAYRKHGNIGLSSLIPIFICAHERISVEIKNKK